MRSWLRPATAIAAVTAIGFALPAAAQKSGGILKMYDPDSPPTMSILEEATIGSQAPMMGVFNNLVMYDQHVPQNSLSSIVPDLATGWSWNEDGTALTLPLRKGVKWHDGKPFTAADVKCTWDLLMETGSDKLRFNPRKSLYKNLDHVSTTGDYEVTFQLKRPQPGFLNVLAGGFSSIYPCHVPAAQMRQHPIGTGPFKFVEFKQNESIKVAKNPDYWKPGLPYLDGIEYTIIKDPSTAVLAFIAGLWGLPSEILHTLPGYGPDVQKNRAEARQIMQKLGYGPDNPLKIKVSTRDLTIYRDPAVILIDQLKQVYFDGELELIDTSRYFPKIMRKEFTIGLNLQTSGAEAIDLFYACGSSLNWDGYCNKAVDELLQQQSEAADEERRKQLLWAIERKLAEDFARPIIFYGRIATCWQPYVKNITLQVNSVFSGNRREDTWLDK